MSSEQQQLLSPLSFTEDYNDDGIDIHDDIIIEEDYTDATSTVETVDNGLINKMKSCNLDKSTILKRSHSSNNVSSSSLDDERYFNITMISKLQNIENSINNLTDKFESLRKKPKHNDKTNDNDDYKIINVNPYTLSIDCNLNLTENFGKIIGRNGTNVKNLSNYYNVLITVPTETERTIFPRIILSTASTSNIKYLHEAKDEIINILTSRKV